MIKRKTDQANVELFNNLLPVCKTETKGIEYLEGHLGTWYGQRHTILVRFDNGMKPEYWMS